MLAGIVEGIEGFLPSPSSLHRSTGGRIRFASTNTPKGIVHVQPWNRFISLHPLLEEEDLLFRSKSRRFSAWIWRISRYKGGGRANEF